MRRSGVGEDPGLDLGTGRREGERMLGKPQRGGVMRSRAEHGRDGQQGQPGNWAPRPDRRNPHLTLELPGQGRELPASCSAPRVALNDHPLFRT